MGWGSRDGDDGNWGDRVGELGGGKAVGRHGGLQWCLVCVACHNDAASIIRNASTYIIDDIVKVAWVENDSKR